MVTVRVLRPTIIRGIHYRTGTELRMTEARADSLLRLGLVAIVTATPAPTYSHRAMYAEGH